MKKQLLIYLLLIINVLAAFSQKANNDITHGNEKYNVNQFTDAEVEYRKALSADSTSFIANYDLGNALYRQGKYGEALDCYLQSLANIKNNKKLQPKQLAATFHNVGNALLTAQQYEQSIEAYKNALKINPRDDETRYNLAYAQQFLRKNQQQQQSSTKSEKSTENNQQKTPPPPNQNQQQQPKMSKEEAQQLLNALTQDEKQTKANAQKAVSRSRQQPEKDW
ncbi:MAG: tetratricopeptide repeat protein [Prevotellaceae bacterium]|jgi:tetratricopeptide (TPR) repeat protein|nr:tetratricopeptide repeat protein [Prevotellaceae bacterium]